MDDSLTMRMGPPPMDGSETIQRSQPALKLEELYRQKADEHARRMALLQQLIQETRQRYPHWSPLAIYTHASGLVKQQEIQDYQRGRAENFMKQKQQNPNFNIY